MKFNNLKKKQAKIIIHKNNLLEWSKNPLKNIRTCITIQQELQRLATMTMRNKNPSKRDT